MNSTLTFQLVDGLKFENNLKNRYSVRNTQVDTDESKETFYVGLFPEEPTLPVFVLENCKVVSSMVLGLWPGPKWAGFGQIGLLNGFSYYKPVSFGLGNLENRLTRVNTRANFF